MTRFLRLKSNVEVWRNLKFLSCNNFAEAADLSMSAKRMYDVLSFESKSYYGEREAFKSLVGDGEGPVPVLNGSQPSGRLCRKVNETDVVQVQPSQRPIRRLRRKCKPALSPASPPTCVVKTEPTAIK